MMKAMQRSLWVCRECEAKETDMKAVLQTVKSIKTELDTVTKRQKEQETERAKVVEGLKLVESVAKRMEKVEEKQEEQEQQLAKHEVAINSNSRKCAEGEKKMKGLEDRMEKIEKSDHNSFDMRQVNAVAKEVREMDKREKDLNFFNVPEAKEGEEDDVRREDGVKIKKIFQELGRGEIQPTDYRRIGKTGKYPRKILMTLSKTEEGEKVMKRGREGPALADNIFITRDRTFNQRQEARLWA